MQYFYKAKYCVTNVQLFYFHPLLITLLTFNTTQEDYVVSDHAIPKTVEEVARICEAVKGNFLVCVLFWDDARGGAMYF